MPLMEDRNNNLLYKKEQDSNFVWPMNADVGVSAVFRSTNSADLCFVKVFCAHYTACYQIFTLVSCLTFIDVPCHVHV